MFICFLSIQWLLFFPTVVCLCIITNQCYLFCICCLMILTGIAGKQVFDQISVWYMHLHPNVSFAGALSIEPMVFSVLHLYVPPSTDSVGLVRMNRLLLRVYLKQIRNTVDTNLNKEHRPNVVSVKDVCFDYKCKRLLFYVITIMSIFRLLRCSTIRSVTSVALPQCVYIRSPI